MRKATLICLPVALAAALSGCAAQATPHRAPTPATQSLTESPAPTLTAAPSQSPTVSGPEVEFLTATRGRDDIATLREATDSELLSAGVEACKELAENPDVQALRLVDGEVPTEGDTYLASGTIGVFAKTYLCPDITQ